MPAPRLTRSLSPAELNAATRTLDRLEGEGEDPKSADNLQHPPHPWPSGWSGLACPSRRPTRSSTSSAGPVRGLDQLAIKVDPELGIGEFKADVLEVAIGLLLARYLAAPWPWCATSTECSAVATTWCSAGYQVPACWMSTQRLNDWAARACDSFDGLVLGPTVKELQAAGYLAASTCYTRADGGRPALAPEDRRRLPARRADDDYDAGRARRGGRRQPAGRP